jgi:hypothetical protein
MQFQSAEIDYPQMWKTRYHIVGTPVRKRIEGERSELSTKEPKIANLERENRDYQKVGRLARTGYQIAETAFNRKMELLTRTPQRI